jgi:hypothetical protein
MFPGTLMKKLNRREKSYFRRLFRAYRLSCQLERIEARSELYPLVLPFHKHDLVYAHVGIGHADDMDYIPYLWQAGFCPEVLDISNVGLKKGLAKAEGLRRSHGHLNLPEAEDMVKFWDLLEVCNDGSFDPAKIFLIDMSRLIHHFDPETRKMVLRGLGKLFQFPHREIDFTVPLADKNKGYDYQRSFPVTIPDILEPLQEGAGKELIVLQSQMRDHNFCFHQKYTFFPVIDPQSP